MAERCGLAHGNNPRAMDVPGVVAIVALILAMVVPIFFLMRTQKQGDEQEVHLPRRPPATSARTALPCHCRRRTRRLS